LGKFVDRVVAKRYRVSLAVARRWRVERGIAPAGHTPTPCPPEAEKLLGTMTDREIADRFKVTWAIARKWRIQKGIEPHGGNRGRKTTPCPPEAVELLGTMTDRALGEKFGVSTSIARGWRLRHDKNRRRGAPRKEINVPPEAIPYLGEFPDTEVGDLFGVSTATARQWRMSRQIEANRPRAPNGAGHQPRKIEALTGERREKMRMLILREYSGLIHRLGEEPDNALAKEYGISRERVRQFRVYLGIPKWKKGYRVPLEKIKPHLKGNTDVDVRRITGATDKDVKRARKETGILRPDQERAALLESIEDRLGTVSDFELAMEIGLAPQRVTDHRHKLGIEATQPAAPDRKLDREVIRDLFHDGLTDAEIAIMLDCSAVVVNQILCYELGLKRKRKPHCNERIDRDEVMKLVREGCSDKVIADIVGCKAQTVGVIRRKHGVKYQRRIDWGPIDPLLGEFPDYVLSKEYNIPAPTILYRRRKLGIPSYSESNKE